MSFSKKLDAAKKQLNDYSNKPPGFSFDGLNVVCECLSVYDGDTISLKVYMGPVWGCRLIKCRMFGYDSSEVKGAPADGKEFKTNLVMLGHEARDYLKSLIENKIVAVRFHTSDLYGRPLVDVFTFDDNVCDQSDLWLGENYVNQKMIDNGHGTVYLGTGVKKNNRDVMLLRDGLTNEEIINFYIAENRDVSIVKLDSNASRGYNLALTQFNDCTDDEYETDTSSRDSESSRDSSDDSNRGRKKNRRRRRRKKKVSV